MHATGLLFLSRTKPQARRAADGTFGLLLYALDRIGPHQVESWVVLWHGEEAEAFWAEHRQHLVPGTPIEVTTDRIRAHQLRGCVPEIHATATCVRINTRQAHPTESPQPAQATA